MRLIEGQLIHRRYRLDSRLAQGGMGEVWRAWDIQLGRPVAIKALRSDQADVEAKLHRLRAEAHNSANLAHPNIAALFEYYEHDGIGFLIMEYVPSKSLADLYHERGAMDPTELLPILIQTARGLFVAHSHGVIHRDVKPANIMVSDSSEVKITDFGVSYSTNQEQITQDGMVVGTAQYISPEQAQGHQATPQSDIYSLGVVAYEGLCGHRPFTGATPVDIAAAHVNDPVPPLPDTVDLQLSQFVMSMLAKDPLDRPADALVVSRTLARIERRLLDQATAQSDDTTVSPTGRMPRRVRSRPHAVNTLLRAVDPEHLTARRPDRPMRVPTPPLGGPSPAVATGIPGTGMPSPDGPTMPPVVTPSIAGTALPDLPSLPDLPASVNATIGEITLAAHDTGAPAGITPATDLDNQNTAASYADLRNLWKEQQ